MVEYKIIFSKLADEDKKLLKQADLEYKTKELLDLISINPYQTPPPYEKQKGILSGCYSRRISYQHRLVYEIDENKKEIFILRMWTYYDKL
jgi:toxin YoeB